MTHAPTKTAQSDAGRELTKQPPSDLGRAGSEAFTEHLQDVRGHVDRRLRAIWDEKIREVERYGEGVAAIAAAARDLTLRGGKRFRAALLVAAYEGAAPEKSREPALEGGVALELIQSYLLIQDDWMDGDATRRGGPSAHAALTEALGGEHLGASGAILASDLTWGLAIATFARVDAPAPMVLGVISALCRVHEDVVIGQSLDMIGRADDVETMHDLKTGSYTVRGPLLLGATLAGAPSETLAALERYAAPLGVAFQLRDDLLGTFGTSEETGKPYGGDLRAGKRTAVFVEAEKRLSAEERALVDRALGKADASDEAVRAAADAIEACGARGAVASRLGALCDEAEALSAELPIAEGAREVLRGAAIALRLDAPRGQARGGARG
jgi:geranylgeranyl diphosphate synthase type I